MTLTAAGAAAFLPGCDLLAIDPEEGNRQEAPGSKGKEAPDLAQQVEDGNLPPIKDRLPESPRVIQPVERTGTYGGSWRTVLTSNDHTWLWTTVDYGEHLVHWTPDWEEVVPHVAESFETLADGKEYLFTLRKGTKWSDGEPFSAESLFLNPWRVVVGDLGRRVVPGGRWNSW